MPVWAKGMCKMAPSWLLYKKKILEGVLSKFGSKSSQISWGSQKNQIWSDRSGKRWRDNDRREKVPFQALIIKEIRKSTKKCSFCSFWPVLSKYMKNWPILSCRKFSGEYIENNFFLLNCIFTPLWRQKGVKIAHFWPFSRKNRLYTLRTLIFALL